MKQDKNKQIRIYKELNELDSSLSPLKIPIDSEIPVDYFESLPDRIIEKAKSAKEDFHIRSFSGFRNIAFTQWNLAVAASFAILLFALYWFYASQQSARLNEYRYEDLINYVIDDLNSYDMEALIELSTEVDFDLYESFDLDDEAVDEYIEMNIDYIDPEEFEELL